MLEYQCKKFAYDFKPPTMINNMSHKYTDSVFPFIGFIIIFYLINSYSASHDN